MNKTINKTNPSTANIVYLAGWDFINLLKLLNGKYLVNPRSGGSTKYFISDIRYLDSEATADGSNPFASSAHRHELK